MWERRLVSEDWSRMCIVEAGWEEGGAGSGYFSCCRAIVFWILEVFEAMLWTDSSTVLLSVGYRIVRDMAGGRCLGVGARGSLSSLSDLLLRLQ